MTNAAERLRFAVRFARMDLDRTRPGDWMNLRDELERFVGVQAVNTTIERPPGSRTARIVKGRLTAVFLQDGNDDQVIRDLQPEARAVLTYVAGQIVGVYGQAPCIHTPSIEKTVLVSVDGLALSLTGTLHDLFFDTLLHDLWRPESLRRRPILLCPEPECQKLFYRVRKQKYCSPKCAHKASWRDYKDTREGKAAKKRSDKNRREKVKAAKQKRRTRR